MAMILLFNVISVTFGSTLNVTILFIYIACKYWQGNSDPCITCSSSIFSFSCLNNKKITSLLIRLTETNNYSFDSNNSSLLLNPSPKLTNLVNQFNNNAIIDNNNSVDDNSIHSKYFDIDEIQKLKIMRNKENVSPYFI